MQAGLPENLKSVGLVVIGRNEGERFLGCLASLPSGIPAVYVDSGSTDASVANAEAANVYVAILSHGSGFTAARARNLGWRMLVKKFPNLDYVQFIDGDCSLDSRWLGEGLVAIEQDERLAIVFGRNRERYPEMSFYNGQCDREWDVPVGEVLSCGGNALMRIAALIQVGGFKDRLIAGEEPDLCIRLRSLGWRIRRIKPEMTTHDAAILTFGSWWQRAKRAGHAYAEQLFIHGRLSLPNWSRALASMLFWALLFPFLIILGLILGFVSTEIWFLLSMAITIVYFFQFFRLWHSGISFGLSRKVARAEAFLLLVAKFAHFAGATIFVLNSIKGKRPVLMEYK